MDETTVFAGAADFGDWLTAYGDSAGVLWVGFHGKQSGVPSLTWAESVDEALCHGWIDGLRQNVDDGRYRVRFTPRRVESRWSAKNRARIEELIADSASGQRI